jgi:predicted RNA-binding protein
MVKPVFNCPVALINTTGETGLANSLAKMLEKSSFSIIKKDNNAENLEQTKIIYNSEEESCNQLLKKLDKILPQSLLVADKNEPLENRSAMVIYIGRDMADLYVFFVNLFHGQL